MSWKIALIGGVVYYLAMFGVSIFTGYFIHSQDGVLAEVYRATAPFWRPELSANPPDIGATFKMWIPSGLLGAMMLAGVYSVVRSSLAGAAWKRGLKFGVIASVFGFAGILAYRGLFNLPDQLWAWWLIGATIVNLAGGIVLGWIAQKLAPA